MELKTVHPLYCLIGGCIKVSEGPISLLLVSMVLIVLFQRKVYDVISML